ncbi:hypothetical protein [Cupriavidus agavae]|nr:hypothetical protein [Cupriavidus agavae]
MSARLHFRAGGCLLRHKHAFGRSFGGIYWQISGIRVQIGEVA